MPRASETFQIDNADNANLIDTSIKASIAAGLQANQIAENIVIAKRGMSGISWPIEITISILDSGDASSLIQLDGKVGGYGPIQKSELNKCIAEISSQFKLSKALASNSRGEGLTVKPDRSSPQNIGALSSTSTLSPSMSMSSTSIDMNVAYLMKELSSTEKIMFQNEYSANKKSVTTGVLLALFVGGLGVHKFWLGSTGLGILYLVFFWSFIPAFAAIIDACLMGNTVKNYNLKVANNSYQKIMMMR